MREFLSQNSVDYEDRNIAFEPSWRKALMDLTGEIVVPVLVVGGRQIVGLDEAAISEALGLQGLSTKSNRDGLTAPPELANLQVSSDQTAADLTHLMRRIQQEMEFNASKDDAPYRDGVHDGLRFARDAVLRILTGKYEPEKISAERQPEAD